MTMSKVRLLVPLLGLLVGAATQGCSSSPAANVGGGSGGSASSAGGDSGSAGGSSGSTGTGGTVAGAGGDSGSAGNDGSAGGGAVATPKVTIIGSGS